MPWAGSAFGEAPPPGAPGGSELAAIGVVAAIGVCELPGAGREPVAAASADIELAGEA